MSKQESIRIGNQILQESDLEFTVNYNGEQFTLKLPNPYEKTLIEGEIAQKLGGNHRAVFTPQHLTLVEACTYVNRMLIPERSPDWFKSAWTCHDEECIYTLFNGYLQFRDKFKGKLRSGGFKGPGQGGKT